MNKRDCERIPSSLVVKFLQNESVCYGIVTNLSEKGMCIKSGICFPLDSKIKLQIPLKKGHLNIPVRVMRIDKTDDFYDTMGVELIKTTKKYLNIVQSISMTLDSV